MAKKKFPSTNLNDGFRAQFWSQVPEFAGGIRLSRLEALVSSQRGPGGVAVFDLAEIVLPSRRLPIVLAYRQSLVPGEISRLKRKLQAIEDQLRLRTSGRLHRVLMIATETAGPGVQKACQREGVGLVDLRGTIIVHSPEVFIQEVGRNVVMRAPRTPLFHGKGCRVVRTLLNSPGQRYTIRQISEQVQTSYAYVYDVVYLLEQEGFALRRSPRSGVILRDPVGLLRAWTESGARTAVATEGFYARSTTPEALRRGFESLRAQGIGSTFTLASGLLDEERFVSALPHGLYCGASIELIIEAFGLRMQTPNNFLLLRPEPAADSDAGGVAASPRALSFGPAVAVPQLIVDLHGLGGRGKDQGEHLLEPWAKNLPLVDVP